MIYEDVGRRDRRQISIAVILRNRLQRIEDMLGLKCSKHAIKTCFTIIIELNYLLDFII